MITCSKCTIEQPKVNFYNLKQSQRCKECQKKYAMAWQRNNPDRVRETRKRSRAKHLEKNRQRVRTWLDENKERRRAYRRDYCRNRYKTDDAYRLSVSLRNRLKVKNGSAIKDLGCSIVEFKLYIEHQFQEGMNWNNHGEWHLDHVLPLSSFDLTNRMELLEACNWLNIQPLWAKDNLRKGNNNATTK